MGPSVRGVELIVSTPAPKTGLGGVDRFVEVAEADAELPSRTIWTTGSGSTLGSEALPAGG